MAQIVAAVAAVRGGLRRIRQLIVQAARPSNVNAMYLPPGRAVANRYPGSGLAAGLVTRPCAEGKAKTLSIKAAGLRMRAGSAVTTGMRSSGISNAREGRVMATTTATGQAKSFNAAAIPNA